MEKTQKGNIFQLTDEGKNFLQLFLRFLKEYNYFYNYKKAYEKCKAANEFDHLIVSCNCLSPNIISNTLYWDETAEGFDYWRHANAQFKELCTHILK